MWIDKDSLKEVIKQYCEGAKVNCPDDMLSEDKDCLGMKYTSTQHTYFIG